MGNHVRCRICDTKLPAPFLDLGAMPLANSFLRSADQFTDEPKFPLAVARCRDCGLVQLNHVVPAEQLYREYIYVSATSEAVRRHAENLAERLTRRHGWGPTHLVVEIASNDGTVLKEFQRRGTRVLGIEPARNIAAIAEQNGIPTVPEFFTAAIAAEQHERVGAAAAIIARHVFAHVDDVHDFLRGVGQLLGKDGILVIEVPYLGELVANLEFDTIYHEHLSYVSLGPILRLCETDGFRLIDVEPVALHGGSILLYLCPADAPRSPSDRLTAMLRAEEAKGLTKEDGLEAFAARVRDWKRHFEDFIGNLRRAGADLIGYGAAAKANTLLNYCPDAAAALRLILDRSPLKHGLYTPGMHIPVVPVETGSSDAATHMLILAWNFQEEIVRQMRPFAERGGRFLIPIPEPRLV